MAVSDDSESARLGAAVVRLERRIEELAAEVKRQDDKLDRLLALTAHEESEQGPKLHELLAELVRPRPTTPRCSRVWRSSSSAALDATKGVLDMRCLARY